MSVDRIKSRLRELLKESPKKLKEEDVPDWAEDEDEFVADPEDGQAEPQDQKSGSSQADYGAGITGFENKPKPKIRNKEYKSRDKGTIGAKSKRATDELSKDIESGKYEAGLTQFFVTPEELRKEIEDRILSKWASKNLDKEPAETMMSALRKLIVEKKNEDNQLSQAMINALKEFNYNIAGPPTNRDEHIASGKGVSGVDAKAQFGGGGGGGNLENQTLALTVPNIENFDGKELIDAIKTSLIKSTKTPQHIINQFMKSKETDIPEMSTYEDVISTLDKLDSELSQMPNFNGKSYVKRNIDSAKNAVEQNGIDTRVGARKTPLIDFIKNNIQSKMENAKQKMNESVAGDPAKSEERVLRYYKWLKNNQYSGLFKRAKQSLDELFNLMKQSEINHAIISGIVKKLKKLENLKKKAPVPGQEGTKIAASTLMDPNDFVVVMDDEDFEGMQDIMKEHKNMNNKQKPEYKRKRSMTRKGLLKEIWKQKQDQILKKQINTEKKKVDTPDIHLGGLS